MKDQYDANAGAANQVLMHISPPSFQIKVIQTIANS